MELSVLNIKGEDTGRKVILNDAVFGIKPNDHAIYLDVKQFMANKRQGTHKTKERGEVSGSTKSWVVRKVAAVPVAAVSSHRFWLVVAAHSVPYLVTTASR